MRKTLYVTLSLCQASGPTSHPSNKKSPQQEEASIQNGTNITGAWIGWKWGSGETSGFNPSLTLKFLTTIAIAEHSTTSYAELVSLLFKEQLLLKSFRF